MGEIKIFALSAFALLNLMEGRNNSPIDILFLLDIYEFSPLH
jgi:hypothetical protein